MMRFVVIPAALGLMSIAACSAPATVPQTPDEFFLAKVHGNPGIEKVLDGDNKDFRLIEVAHSACKILNFGVSKSDLEAKLDKLSPADAKALVNAAVAAYCPSVDEDSTRGGVQTV